MKLKIYAIILVVFGIETTSHAQTKVQNFLDDLSTGDSAAVSIFADGNLQGIMADNEDNSAAIATGAIGISVSKPKVVWVASINIASTADTLSSGFATMILNPASGGALRSGLLEFYLKDIKAFENKAIGLHGYANSSTGMWNINDSAVSVSIFGAGALLVNEVINEKKGDNSVYLGFELGVAYRGVLGDIKESLYENAFETKGNHFFGFEGGLKIRFNKISAGLQGFLLYDLEEKKKINGVTSFQLTGGISISGPIFQETYKINK